MAFSKRCVRPSVVIVIVVQGCELRHHTPRRLHRHRRHHTLHHTLQNSSEVLAAGKIEIQLCLVIAMRKCMFLHTHMVL